MNKQFIAPEVEFVNIISTDVITTSSTTGKEPDTGYKDDYWII